MHFIKTKLSAIVKRTMVSRHMRIKKKIEISYVDNENVHETHLRF